MQKMHRAYNHPTHHAAPRPADRVFRRPNRRWWPVTARKTYLPALLFGLYIVGLLLFWTLVGALL